MAEIKILGTDTEVKCKNWQNYLSTYLEFRCFIVEMKVKIQIRPTIMDIRF